MPAQVLRLPHPFVLLLAGVAVAVALTWVIPAGTYERRPDPATGREVVVPGTYHRVNAAPLGLMGGLLAAPRGIVAGADVILTILVVGGTFALLDATGALRRLVTALVGRRIRPPVLVAIVALTFASLGALENMQEEIIALVPVLLLLSRGIGFGPVTAMLMSTGAAIVGSAFGPTNPFQTGIALRFAGMPSLSQPLLRTTMLVAAVSIWIAWTLFAATRDRVPTTTAGLQPPAQRATARDLLLLAIAIAPFGPYIFGVLRLDWGFNELSALFLVAGFAIGLVSGLGLDGTARDFLAGMTTMLAAALFVGVARGISVALTDGQVIDTIIYALATPLDDLPRPAAALVMVPIHALIHIPVSSVSGQAVLTMPIMAPLADLLGISRDAAVIAYQTGGGLMDMATPTNGALLAVLYAAGVPYGRWLTVAVPGALLVSIVGIIGILVAG